MKNKTVRKRVFIAIGALIVVALFACATVVALNHFKGERGQNIQGPVGTPGDQEQKDNEEEKPKPSVSDAKALEDKANNLVTKDRSAASDSYKKAAEAYKAAGKSDKAAQMEASAEAARPKVKTEEAPKPTTTVRGMSN